jgi:rubrerythrin
MVGVINHWDILAHPVVTIRCFGWGVFFRAIGPWQSKPFLSLLRDAGHFGAADSKVPAILERCVGLELRAKAIYKALARTFADKGLVAPFFAGLAEQEQHHADLLELGRAVAIRSGWKAHLFNPWDDFLPRLEQQIAAAEAAVSKVDSVEAALHLVVQIESSEINQVFYAALTATDSAFVKKLRPFRETMEAHMAYLVERLPQLCPNMLLACRELRAKFPAMRRQP